MAAPAAQFSNGRASEVPPKQHLASMDYEARTKAVKKLVAATMRKTTIQFKNAVAV